MTTTITAAPSTKLPTTSTTTTGTPTSSTITPPPQTTTTTDSPTTNITTATHTTDSSTVQPTTTQPTAPTTFQPTPNPIHICNTLRDGRNYDFIIMYDNSCGLDFNECDVLLEGVGELITSFIDDDDTHTRVQVMEFNSDGYINNIVGFDEILYQNDVNL